MITNKWTRARAGVLADESRQVGTCVRPWVWAPVPLLRCQSYPPYVHSGRGNRSMRRWGRRASLTCRVGGVPNGMGGLRLGWGVPPGWNGGLPGHTGKDSCFLANPPYPTPQMPLGTPVKSESVPMPVKEGTT